MKKTNIIYIDDIIKKENIVVPPQYYRIIKDRPLAADYKLEKTKIKNICRRCYGGKVYAIKDLPVYYYVKGGKKAYMDYVKEASFYYAKGVLLSDVSNDLYFSRFDKLIDSLEKNGYDKKIITICDSDMIIRDGQHRLAWLAYKYGEDYEIPVLQLKFLSYPFFSRATLISLLSVFIPITHYRKEFRKKYKYKNKEENL